MAGRPLEGKVARVAGAGRGIAMTDLDGSRPVAWRYVVEVQDASRPADVTGCR